SGLAGQYRHPPGARPPAARRRAAVGIGAGRAGGRTPGGAALLSAAGR
nr:hypothetical protein [Tanacetum cinerariifolium]